MVYVRCWHYSKLAPALNVIEVVMKLLVPQKLMLSIMISIPVIASANDFKMKNVKNPEFSYSNFPFISSEKYPQSASNINTYLQYHFFERPLKEDDFSNTSLSPFRHTESHRRVYSLYEPVIYESTNYVEVSIQGEACGAYCEGFNETFLFDAYSGQLITLIDLLSSNGVNQLEDKIRASNLKIIEPYIKNEPAESDHEYAHEEYSIYKDCYDRFKGDRKYYNKVDEETSFSLSNDLLVIEHGRCSNHASRALDEIGKFVNKFSVKELQPYLSTEGKQYLSDHQYQLSAIKTPYKVLHGKIANKYPITLLKPKYGGWVYWYDKYESPIELREVRSETKNDLFFREAYYDDVKDKWVYTAEWQIREKNKVFTGTFTRSSDGKEMEVSFK